MSYERRPLAVHTLAVELELVTAADIDRATLVRALTQLATAGLYGMVSRVLHVSLDGASEHPDVSVVLPAAADIVRPPPDPRLTTALVEVERLGALLRLIQTPEAVRRTKPRDDVAGTQDRTTA